MTKPDHRLHAYRDDLADMRLKDQVRAGRFVEGTLAQISVPVADIRSEPSAAAGLDTQFLLGQHVRLFDEKDGWCWVQGERDGYVGYTPVSNVTDDTDKHTHRVTVPRTFVYSEPDMKKPVLVALSLAAEVTIIDSADIRGTAYSKTGEGGWVVTDHFKPMNGQDSDDFVTWAGKLVHTPYLWGGTSAFGIDCSGLVQLSLRMAGVNVLRDTDMQSETIGKEVDPGSKYQNLHRGDLVFWKGHVAIMLDDKNVIHANGHTMMVSIEPLAEAIQRIAYLYAEPRKFRRPNAPIG